MQDTSNMLTRWAIALQNFDFTVKHVAGKPSIVPDTLSRLLRNINKKLVSNDPALASICRNAPNDRPYHRAGPRDFETSVRSLEQSELVQNDRESFASAVSVFLLIKRTPSSGTERGAWEEFRFFLLPPHRLSYRPMKPQQHESNFLAREGVIPFVPFSVFQ